VEKSSSILAYIWIIVYVASLCCTGCSWVRCSGLMVSVMNSRLSSPASSAGQVHFVVLVVEIVFTLPFSIHQNLRSRKHVQYRVT